MVVLGKGGKRRVTDVKEVDGEGGVPLTNYLLSWISPMLRNIIK